jgi:hypothetical protein
MANSDKDILITPNNDADPKPEISFVGFNNAPIKLLVEDDNSISFEGGAGQLYNIDNNLSANETFSVTDESGIPVIAYNVDGTVLLSPFSGSTSVGTKKSVGRLHVKPDTNAPAITLPNETNPRYSVGLGSTFVSTTVGQRLDFYTGDSGNNDSNLGTNQLRMSLTGQGRLGVRTNNPQSIIDVRPLTYSANQTSDGYAISTTGGEWTSRFFMRSDVNGVPFTGLETPSDAEGNTVEAFQVQGSNAGFVRLRPGGADYIVNASSERLGINRNIATGSDTRSVLEIDGGIRIRDNNGGATPSKPGHIGLWEAGISSTSKLNGQFTYGTNNNDSMIRLIGYVDYSGTSNPANRTNYFEYNTLVVRFNDLSNPANNGFRFSSRLYPKEFTITSLVGNNGNINNSTGEATSGTPTVLTLSEDISEIYGPFPITNVTGWPTTAPTPNALGNYSTYNIYFTLGNNSKGESHQYEVGTGIFISGVGGGLDRGYSIVQVLGDRRVRVQLNGSNWTAAATTSGGSCRGMWIQTTIHDAGGASTAQTVSWNWYRTFRFKTDAANPARTLTIGGNFSDNNVYPDTTSGKLRIYRNYSSSHYLTRNDIYVGAGSRALGWAGYIPTHMVYNETRTGSENNQRMGAARTDTLQAYRGHCYNLFGAYTPSILGYYMYNRMYRGGRADSQYGYFSEVRNGLYNNTSSSAYVARGYGFHAFLANRGISRTNDMRGIYNYLRCGENATLDRAVVNNAYASWMYIRADGGTITNAYLYGGVYRTGSNNPNAVNSNGDPAPTQSIITNRWGLYLDDNSGTMKHRLDGRLTINNGTTVYTDPTNNIWLNVNGSIYYNNHAIIAARGADNSNVDHIWHDDGTTDGAPGSWNFCSDVGYKAAGNSRIRCGQVDAAQTNGTSTFSGNLTVSGTKNFQIDHPLDSLKDTHFLIHASVESPQLDLIYRGSSTLSNGSITIDIDEHFGMTAGTFVALNGDIQCFTTNETGWSPVRGRVKNGALTIECQDETSTDTISWMVVGRRIDEKTIITTTTDDQGKLILEVSKDSEIFSMKWDHELEGTTSGDGDDLINTKVRFK